MAVHAHAAPVAFHRRPLPQLLVVRFQRGRVLWPTRGAGPGPGGGGGVAVRLGVGVCCWRYQRLCAEADVGGAAGAGFGLGGEVVGVVGAGVVWVGVCSEAPVDYCGGGVDVDFAGFGPARCHGAFARLRSYVADWAVEGGVDEFRVVFVHYFAVDE